MRLSIVSPILLGCVLPVLAEQQHHQLGSYRNHHHRPPPVLATGNATIYNETFQQLIDHGRPSMGTFTQRYYYSLEFYTGPGCPVVLFTPGEVAADNYKGYLKNTTLTGVFAQAVGGVVIILEHRYWGGSSPYATLTTDALKQLTLKNSIADLTHFAKHVKLPFDTSGQTNADKAPWILSGGSYSGALAAWTSSTKPGTFWAYHASSAPVQAIYDYWQYFYPIQQGMPQNCSKDVSLVVDYVDEVLATGSAANKTALKTMFGLQNVTHDDDFAATLPNGPWAWQSNSFTTNYSQFFQFCDAVEGVKAGQNKTPSAEGVGLDIALAGYASWINGSFLPGYCQGYGYPNASLYDTQCLNTYDLTNPLYTDYSVGNPFDRQWIWMLCNEPFAYWQDGAPAGTSTIIPRAVTAAYWQRQCNLMFPTTNGTTFGSSSKHHPPLMVNHVNNYTSGWNIPAKANSQTRLIWVNGEFDPWRTSGVSSQFRPGGPLVSTPDAPVNIIPGAFHCSDFKQANAKANAGVQTVVDKEVAQIKAWTAEYYATEKRRRVQGLASVDV